MSFHKIIYDNHQMNVGLFYKMSMRMKVLKVLLVTRLFSTSHLSSSFWMNVI